MISLILCSDTHTQDVFIVMFSKILFHYLFVFSWMQDQDSEEEKDIDPNMLKPR